MQLAVESAGLFWSEAKDGLRSCYVSRDLDNGELEEPELPSASFGSSARIAASERQRQNGTARELLVLVYPSPEGFAAQWTVDPDGGTHSGPCGEGFRGTARSAGNIVVIVPPGSARNGAWIPLLFVLESLGGKAVQVADPGAEDPTDRVFRTQELLGGVFLVRGRPAAIDSPHPCQGGDATITGWQIVPESATGEFWVIEYPTPTSAAAAWRWEPDGTAAPLDSCFDSESLDTRRGNMVLEIPDRTRAGDLILSVLVSLGSQQSTEPWTLLDLAEAIDVSDLRWGGHGDNRIACTGREDSGRNAGFGLNTMIADPARPDLPNSITVYAFTYSSPEALARQWDVGADGSAISDVCGAGKSSFVAGNIAVTYFEFEEDPAQIWPRVVDVVSDLASQVE